MGWCRTPWRGGPWTINDSPGCCKVESTSASEDRCRQGYQDQRGAAVIDRNTAKGKRVRRVES